ncbi:MAG: lytic transglycosylase domain-containing protein [Candidatus Eisenbacteria bacterium]
MGESASAIGFVDPRRAASATLRASGAGLAGRSSSDVRDAFEALLLGELVAPLEESLRRAGLFPEGSAGEIYAYFWKQNLGNLLAQAIELIPGLDGLAGDEETRGTGQDGLRSLLSADRSLLTPGAAEGGIGSARAAVASTSLQGAPAGVSAVEPAPAGRLVSAVEPAPAGRFVSAVESAPAGPSASAAQPGQVAPAAPTPPPAEATRDHPLAERLAQFEQTIREAARAASVGANWVRAVIMQESGGRPEAVSAKGAQGLMQLIPSTARSLGVYNPFDPVENIRAGARYLGSMRERFGDMRLALAAYNAGPSRVSAWGGIPPIAETRTYVDAVLRFKEQFDRLWPADAGGGDVF